MAGGKGGGKGRKRGSKGTAGAGASSQKPLALSAEEIAQLRKAAKQQAFAEMLAEERQRAADSQKLTVDLGNVKLTSVNFLLERAKIAENEVLKETTSFTTKAGAGLAGVLALIAANVTGRDVFLCGIPDWTELLFIVELVLLGIALVFFLLSFWPVNFEVPPSLAKPIQLSALSEKDETAAKVDVLSAIVTAQRKNKQTLKEKSAVVSFGFVALILALLCLVIHLSASGTMAYRGKLPGASPTPAPSSSSDTGGGTQNENKGQGAASPSPSPSPSPSAAPTPSPSAGNRAAASPEHASPAPSGKSKPDSGKKVPTPVRS